MAGETVVTLTTHDAEERPKAVTNIEECNVICVDWEAGATIPNYVRASANTRLVGKQLAMLLARLRDELQLDLRTVHLIGFSLGAHVAGFAGAELRNLSRITAHQFLLRVESSPSALPVVSYGKIEVTLLGVTPEANETFTMTRKDDEELKAGGSLSRIVVPHPVMDEPAKVELEYAAYSGWISSGLAKWSVDKVTLTDSFGKSLSFCRKGLILESGVPVRVPLFPGDCNPPGDETTSPAPVSPTPDQEWTKKKDEEEVTVPAKPESVSEVSQEATEATADASSSGDSALDGGKEKAVEELTSNEVIKAIKGGQTTTEGQPQPVTRWDDSNGLGPSDGSREDGARALEGPRRPFPLAKREWKPRHIPVYGSPLMDPRGEWHREMASPEMDPPPIYAPLTWQHWIGGEAEAEAEEKRGDDPRGGNSSGPALVQLLPQRLASFLARAEEYARVTLSGVMAVGGNSSDVARRPKYFPVAAMGRGQAHYYSGRAVVGQGSERALEVQHPRYIPLRRPVPPRGALMVPRR